MNEAGYIRSVHRVLTTGVYRWKINDRFTVGVPDTWYSGRLGSLFVEWKYLKSVPKKTTPKLSAHQKVWLNERLAEGRDVAVIVGTPKGGIILQDGAWNDQVAITDLLSPREIAAWIQNRVNGPEEKQPHSEAA